MLRSVGQSLALLPVAVLAVFAAVPASAEGVPGPYGFTPAEPVVYDWNGFYAGVFGTAGAASVEGGTPGPFSETDGNVGGGVVAGVRRHSGAFVFGGEVDISFADDDVTTTAGGSPLTSGTDWIATLRGRGGYVVRNLFIYGTAGVALADTTTTLPTGSASDTALGWTVGAGVEIPLGTRFTARAEYLYTDLESTSGTAGGTAFDTEYDSHQVRAGVTYKFR